MDQKPKLKYDKESLRGKCIYVPTPEISERVQKHLFSLGFEWMTGYKILKLNNTYIHMFHDNTIAHGNNNSGGGTISYADLIGDILPQIGITAVCKHENKRSQYVRVLGKKVDYWYCPACKKEVI